jgi:2-haloacid dehalogenase
VAAGLKHHYARRLLKLAATLVAKAGVLPRSAGSARQAPTQYKLVVLSNGDPDMLETAKNYHKVPFDRVIAVAEANSFKPHVATYTKAAELLGLRMDQIMFVANHAFDVIGAKSAGMRTAMINRRDRPFERTPHQPDIIVSTMMDLANAMV